MTKPFMLSIALTLLCLNTIIPTHTLAWSSPKDICLNTIEPTYALAWSPLEDIGHIANKLTSDPVSLALASTDFGNRVYKNSSAVFAPSSSSDISKLIKFSNSLSTPFTIAARWRAHSSFEEGITQDGV